MKSNKWSYLVFGVVLLLPLNVLNAQTLIDSILQKLLVSQGVPFPVDITNVVALEKLKASNVVPNLPVPKGITAIEDQTICQVDGVALKADIFMPSEKSASLRPLVMVIHGGAWATGNRKAADARLAAITAAALGDVAISIEYRMTSAARSIDTNPIDNYYQVGADYRLQVEDVLCDTRWAVANAKRFGADPNRVGTLGASTGGHYALMAALANKSSNFRKRGDLSAALQNQVVNIRSVVNLFGITDMSQEWNHLVRLGGSLRNESGPIWTAIAKDYMPGTPDSNPAAFAAASPINYLTQNSPPITTVHGTDDALIPYMEAKDLDAKARRVGARHKLLPIAGANHMLVIDGSGDLIATEALPALSQSLFTLQSQLGAPVTESKIVSLLNTMLNMISQSVGKK